MKKIKLKKLAQFFCQDIEVKILLDTDMINDPPLLYKGPMGDIPYTLINQDYILYREAIYLENNELILYVMQEEPIM